MEFDGRIAEITIEPETKQVIKLNLHGRPLKFRCQRCAVFCCKLGGPKLSRSDIERLKQMGNNPDTFLDLKGSSLKSREDGSCLFLSFKAEEDLYQCSVYDYRPALCRLYPFHFEELGPQVYALKVIPCCNGLNTADGEIVNERFLIKFLRQILLELLESNVI